MAIKYNEKELEPKGYYKTYGDFGGSEYAQVEILNTPVSPRENTLNFFRGKEYYWVPDWSSDYFDFSIDCIPDVKAMGMAGGVDSFGVTWTALETGMPAMVKPGNPKLKDISEWRTLDWPDVDSWDWAGASKNYNAVIDHNRILRPYIQCGLFERMIDLLDFDGALIALLDDPDECKAFLAKLTEYNISLIDHYNQYFDLDAICFLDDWSGQKGPFFSPALAREILFPNLKKIVRHVKDLGLVFTWHSCGNGIDFIPMMLEAGVDAWQLQCNAVDLDEAVRRSEGKLVLETSMVFPLGAPEDKMVSEIRQFVQKFGKNREATFCFCDEYYLTSPLMRNTAYAEGRKLLYEKSREAGEEDR